MVTTAIAIDIITTSSIYFLILTYFNFNLSSILRIYTTIICINFLKVSLFTARKIFMHKIDVNGNCKLILIYVTVM